MQLSSNIEVLYIYRNLMKYTLNIIKIFSFLKKNSLKYFTLFNIVYGLFVVLLTTGLKYLGIGEYLGNFFLADQNHSSISWIFSGCIALFIKLPFKGVIEAFVDILKDILKDIFPYGIAEAQTPDPESNPNSPKSSNSKPDSSKSSNSKPDSPNKEEFPPVEYLGLDDLLVACDNIREELEKIQDKDSPEYESKTKLMEIYIQEITARTEDFSEKGDSESNYSDKPVDNVAEGSRRAELEEEAAAQKMENFNREVRDMSSEEIQNKLDEVKMKLNLYIIDRPRGAKTEVPVLQDQQKILEKKLSENSEIHDMEKEIRKRISENSNKKT